VELREQISPHTRQQVVRLERRLQRERVDERKARLRSKGHRDRHGASQFHNRRGYELGEGIVERGDARPIRFRRRARPGMTSDDRRLKSVRAERATQLFSTPERSQAAAYEDWSQRLRS
jgi:hypothetical protein